MKKNIFRLLCVTLLAGMTFASCERENITPGKYTVTVNSVSINDVTPGFKTFVVDMLTMQRKIRQLKADRILSNF